MPTVAEIADLAFGAVSGAIPGSVHTATISGSEVGRVIEDDKAAPSSFPAQTLKDGTRTVFCEGFTPSVGQTLTYAGADHLVFWVNDIMQADGLAKAAVLPSSDWLSTTVEFQAKSKTRNSSGGFDESWSAISAAPTAAHVSALSGSERFASDRVEAHSSWRIVVEYFAGLKEADSVVVGGRRHNITFIEDWERKGVWLILETDLGSPA